MRAPGWTPPEQFHEYRLVRPLGRGAMGQVYLAHDTYLDRPTAVKFIAQVAPTTAAHERFLVEARAAARLQHPNVVAVYRVGELGRRPYLVSEFIRGESLDKLDKPLPWRRAWELGLGLARGLAAAHRRGVLHRDIKPANAILADDGEVKLLDFGLAKLLETAPPPAADHRLAAGSSPGTVVDAIAATVPPIADDDTRDFVDGRVPAEATAVFEHRLTSLADGAAGSARAGELTHAGAVMGTPYYMSPEAWRGEPATRSSDVYSLGALIYELVTGVSPNSAVPVIDLRDTVQTTDPPPVLARAPGCDPQLAAVIDRCLCRDPDDRFASADALREALEGIVRSARAAAVPEGNPYRGLAAFEAEHRAVFFGRGPVIRHVIERLRAEALVVVAGESGVGKSSLCRAGVSPCVLDGALGDGRTWETVHLFPGKHPLAALCAALAPRLGRSEADLAEAVRVHAAALGRELRAHLGSERGLLVLVDQLEELVTLADPIEAEVVAEALAVLATPNPSVRVVATVRGDFLGRLARFTPLCDELSRGLLLLGPLGPDGLREAIVGPARSKGVRFESEAMVQQLIAAVTRDGSLPLLQFALAELWDARDQARGVITDRALAGLGGVAGALIRHADAVIATLIPAQRQAARRILVQLVTADGTRARRSEAELAGDDAAARGALDRLVRGRLLMPRDDAGGTVYEVAHEALIAEWGTLRDWLEDDGDRRVIHERLARAAAEWQRLGRADAPLWPDRLVVETALVPDDQIRPEERAFLAASRAAIRRRRLTRGALIMAMPVVIGLAYAGVRLQQEHHADRRATGQLARAQAALGQARLRDVTVEVARRAAFWQFDRGAADPGEALWARSLVLADETRRLYADASQQAEAAVMIDPSRADSRTTLADILFERAVIAERDHREDELDELLSRLDAYDDQAERRRRWTAPATLGVTGDCDRVAIASFVEDDDGARWDAVGDEACPARVDLAPGSYLLTLAKVGRVDVTYPVLLKRGEVLELAPPMPAPDEIPDGFVFVPGGRFLRGSTSPEGHRKGFEYAPPLHEAHVDPFLVAKHELTYAEWIAFLDAVPPDERKLRSPRVSTAGLQGSLALTRRDDGWHLTIQPGNVAYAAREGEPIRYTSRDDRIEQDWLRMPVSGISREDVDAYLAWAREHRGLPSARLCRDEEWESSARGADGRVYPHANRLEPTGANIFTTYGWRLETMGPDEVGTHPGSTSPFGIADAAGNVFEIVDLVDSPAARGGAYSFDATAAQAQSRSPIETTFRDINIGVRLCATYPAR
jgi:eukaryotic-like serine/threonine-protein kinase